MDAKQAGSSLDSLMSTFNARITEIQELVIGRNMYPASSVADLLAVDAALKAMELQVQAIKNRLREEAEAIPKANKLIDALMRQQKKLQNMSSYTPSYLPDQISMLSLDTNKSLTSKKVVHSGFSKLLEEPATLPKEKKGCGPPSLWYITKKEFDSLSTYMRGRLTVDKINAAIADIAAHAEANSQLILAPKKKVVENQWEKALELRDIAMNESVKGKYFILETDMKGPVLKLDNTGKAILTVLRHLGRITEIRIGHHRVIIILKSQ